MESSANGKIRNALSGYGREDRENNDMNLGKQQPSLFCSKGKNSILLSKDFENVIVCRDIYQIMGERKTTRLFESDPISILELSYLLWMTQGVKEIAGNAHPVTVRVVPSAGSRHAIETYLFVNRVEGLDAGLYHYLPETHAIELLREDSMQIKKLNDAFFGQSYFAGSAVAFVWSAIPYRMEWRYGDMAQKLILLDAGHICENLYLAAGSIDCGVCAVSTYDQKKADDLLGLSGCTDDENAEMVIYAAGVGKK